MAENVSTAPNKQSKSYKTKSLAQVATGLLAHYGYEVDPEQLVAMLAGIENGYLEVRIAWMRRSVAWVVRKLGWGKLARFIYKPPTPEPEEVPDAQ